MSRKHKGILCILLSAFFFASMSLCVKLAGNIPSMEKAFFRNVIAMIIAGTTLIKSKENLHYEKKDLPLLIARSSFGLLGVLGNFYAVDYLLLADASILQKTNPFFALLFSFLILKEKISWKQLGYISLAFCGVLIVVRPGFDGLALFPSFIAILGAMGAGMAYTIVRLLSQRGVSKSKIIFFFSAFSTLVLLPNMIFHYVPLTFPQFIALLFAGIFAALGQYAVTSAYSYAPAKDISVFDYSQIIFSSILGLFFFGQLPDLFSLIGYVIIILAALLQFLYTQKSSR